MKELDLAQNLFDRYTRTLENKNAFLPANILLPKTDHMEKWAVIACDQFTSDQAYWDRVRKNAEGAV